MLDAPALLWVPFTLMAAFSQSWRNAFQKQLSVNVDTLGVTLARFIFAGPLAALYLFSLYQFKPVAMPEYSAKFWWFIAGATFSQIAATNLMVILFRRKNYAIGVGLAKSEAILAAILGVFFFASSLSLLGWIGVLIGAVAVIMLSGGIHIKALSPSTITIGVLSGLTFALTSLWVREASLVLNLPFPHGAAWVLLWVIGCQTVVLVSWLLVTNRKTLIALLERWPLTFAVSFSSCLGSLGWFTAFSLQTVPLVKTLGQIEVLFTLMISAWFFGEKLKATDHWGLGLIVIAAVMVMWV